MPETLPVPLDAALAFDRGLRTIPAAPPGARLEAGDDIGAIRAWLMQYADNPRTFSNYRKEAERFYLWCQAQGKALIDLRHEDTMRYRVFLAAPPANWIVAATRPNRQPPSRPRAHPAWRPFRRALAKASIRQAEIILNGLLAWLVEAEYLPANPLALSRRFRDNRPKRIARYLTHEQWQRVLDAVTALPMDTTTQKRRAVRDRWMVQLFYRTGLRVSEAAAATMGAFYRRETPKGPRWTLDVIGKGEKPRSIPVTDTLLAELRAYREGVGLPVSPSASEVTPLLPALRGGQAMSRSGTYRALAAVFEAAAKRCTDQADKDKLRLASTHWLRHTRGSHLVSAGTPLKSVQDLLGHASLTTTSLYLHEELDQMDADLERAEANDKATQQNAPQPEATP